MGDPAQRVSQGAFSFKIVCDFSEVISRTKLTEIAVWVLEKVLFKFLGGNPHRGIWGEIFSCMSVCAICPGNRWYQLQDQSGMNYETIRGCRVDSYPSGGNLGEIITCGRLYLMPGRNPDKTAPNTKGLPYCWSNRFSTNISAIYPKGSIMGDIFRVTLQFFATVSPTVKKLG